MVTKQRAAQTRQKKNPEFESSPYFRATEPLAQKKEGERGTRTKGWTPLFAGVNHRLHDSYTSNVITNVRCDEAVTTRQITEFGEKNTRLEEVAKFGEKTTKFEEKNHQIWGENHQIQLLPCQPVSYLLALAWLASPCPCCCRCTSASETR